MSHYIDGPFGNTLASLANELGADNFRCETTFASLVIANFETGENELLVTTAAGYEDKTRIESTRRLWETIGALKEWGKS